MANFCTRTALRRAALPPVVWSAGGAALALGAAKAAAASGLVYSGAFVGTAAAVGAAAVGGAVGVVHGGCDAMEYALVESGAAADATSGAWRAVAPDAESVALEDAAAALGRLHARGVDLAATPGMWLVRGALQERFAAVGWAEQALDGMAGGADSADAAVGLSVASIDRALRAAADGVVHAALGGVREKWTLHGLLLYALGLGAALGLDYSHGLAARKLEEAKMEAKAAAAGAKAKLGGVVAESAAAVGAARAAATGGVEEAARAGAERAEQARAEASGRAERAWQGVRGGLAAARDAASRGEPAAEPTLRRASSDARACGDGASANS